MKIRLLLLFRALLPFLTYSQVEYRVVVDKAYFYTASILDGNAAKKPYLVKGDYTRCAETESMRIREDLENFSDDFCFCWFKRKGVVTTGYLYRSDLTYEEKDRGDWYSLKYIYKVKDRKTYFYLHEQLYSKGPYLIKGDITLCDENTININGKEYCFCEFKKPSGSNKGRLTTGYIERRNLRTW